MKSHSFNWPHAVACVLVAVTSVLLCFGALVTTFDAAMAVPDWPGTYGHNMFLFPWAEWFYGPWDLFLEHGHRLLGALVGMISLVLAAVVWRTHQSPAVRGLAAAAVLLVVVQGVLGGARVLLERQDGGQGPRLHGTVVLRRGRCHRRTDPPILLQPVGHLACGSAVSGWARVGQLCATRGRRPTAAPRCLCRPGHISLVGGVSSCRRGRRGSACCRSYALHPLVRAADCPSLVAGDSAACRMSARPWCGGVGCQLGASIGLAPCVVGVLRSAPGPQRMGGNGRHGPCRPRHDDPGSLGVAVDRNWGAAFRGEIDSQAAAG